MQFNPNKNKQAVQVIFSHKSLKPPNPPLYFNQAEVPVVNEHKHHNLFNPIQSRLFFYRLKVQGGVFRNPLMISRTIKASPMKLCTAIVLLKAYQNKKKIQKYDL